MANEITMRVYEQGQGTVLNGGGAGTVVDRGANYSIPITGLAVGNHTLEVTAQDTAASKAESARVSTGTFTVDAAGYSDAFAGTSGTPLATHNSAWLNCGNGTDWPVSALELDGSGNVRPTSNYDGAGGRYNGSSGNISQIVAKAQTDTLHYQYHKSVTVRDNGTRFYRGALNGSSGSNYGTVTLYAITGSTETYLTSVSGTAYACGSDHTIRITASGSSPVVLNVYVDNLTTPVISAYSDSTYLYTGGVSGFCTGNNAGGQVNGLFDNWQDT